MSMPFHWWGVAALGWLPVCVYPAVRSRALRGNPTYAFVLTDNQGMVWMRRRHSPSAARHKRARKRYVRPDRLRQFVREWVGWMWPSTAQASGETNQGQTPAQPG